MESPGNSNRRTSQFFFKSTKDISEHLTKKHFQQQHEKVFNIPSDQDIQVKSLIRYLPEWHKPRRLTAQNDSKNLQQLNSQIVSVGIQSGSITSKTVSQFPIIHLSYDSEGCILSRCLFNLYAEYIMRNAGLEEAQAGIKIAGRNINNHRYADDTTLMAESKEELRSLLIKMKEESEKIGLKLNIRKTKIMAPGPITSWQIDGETVETVRDWAPKSLQMVIAAMKLKDAYSLEGKL